MRPPERRKKMGDLLKKSLFLAACVAALAVTLVASAAPVPNGEFETGDLAGWTTFTTAGGSIGTPAVVSFDTTGNGASNAAQFNVGRNTGPAGAPEGGGIYQSVNTTAGSFNVSADVAALAAPAGANLSCGFFELLVDGLVVDSHDFTTSYPDFSACPLGTTVRATLSSVGLPLSAGAHEVRIQIRRGGTNFPSTSTPREYVDNVSLTDVTEPPVNEPPVATDDDASGTEDTLLQIAKATLLANDTDGGDGGSLSLTLVDNPSGGTVALNGANVEFTPTANLCGLDEASFDYTVSDGIDTDTGTVTIDLTCVDEPQAMPTTKDQCKNNGWKTYPVFENQGDCVSFVASDGKNPPANG
jgi:Bacterial Ig domain